MKLIYLAVLYSALRSTLRSTLLPFSHLEIISFLTFQLNTELNPICHLLALLGTHPILPVSRIRVN